MKRWKSLTAALCAAVLLCGFSTTAYAGGGEYEDHGDPTMETPAPEPEPRYFMQAQVKYESEIKTAVLGDRTITVKNVTPIYPPQERDKRSREVERRLFDVFVKYAGQRG